MRYLVDTSTLIDFARGTEPVAQRLMALFEGPDELGVCPVVVAEYYSGTSPANRPAADALFATLSYWNVGQEDAVQAGTYRYEFARKGVQLPTTDALVAAVAINRGAVVLTENLKDFPMTDVQIISLGGRDP